MHLETSAHIHYNFLYKDYCPYIQSQRLLFNDNNNNYNQYAVEK